MMLCDYEKTERQVFSSELIRNYIEIPSAYQNPSTRQRSLGSSSNADCFLPDIVPLIFPSGTSPPLVIFDDDRVRTRTPSLLVLGKLPFMSLADLRGAIPPSQQTPLILEIRRKLKRASTETLSKIEEEAYCQVMSKASILEYIDSGLTPHLYSLILEKNCVLAAIILCCQLDLPDDALYLNVLLWQKSTNVNRIMNSLRVIYEVIQRVELHKPFLHQFIHTIFLSCNQMSEYLEQLQVARLICIFLLELWQRTQILPSDDICYEIQSFAVTWIQVKEAASLFRAMKSFSMQ